MRIRKLDQERRAASDHRLERLTFDMSCLVVYAWCMGIASSELRERALTAYQAGKGTQEEIATLYGISSRTFQRWCQRYHRTGSTHPKPRGHRVAVYTGKDLKRLDRAIAKHPDATLEELLELTCKSCSIMAVQRAVVRLGYSLKKNAVGQRTKPA